MDDKYAGELLLMMQARADMQHAFIRALLLRLARDVPDFSLDLLSEHLHVLLQHAAPAHTAPNPNQQLMRETGHEELKGLIEAVEGAIAARIEDGSPHI